MSNASASVVTTHIKLINIQLVQQAHHILRHGAFAVVAVIRQACRVGRIAVAAQIGQDQTIVVFERLRHTMPHDVSLGEAMQQHQHRLVHLLQPTGRKAGTHHHTVHIELSFLKTIKPGAKRVCGGGVVCAHDAIFSQLSHWRNAHDFGVQNKSDDSPQSHTAKQGNEGSQ